MSKQSLKTLALNVLRSGGSSETLSETPLKHPHPSERVGVSPPVSVESPCFESMRITIREPGTWHIVTVRKGRIQIVRDLKPLNPANIVAVWNFRRVRIGEDDWMIGQRDDGKEIAWCVRRSGSKC